MNSASGVNQLMFNVDVCRSAATVRLPKSRSLPPPDCHSEVCCLDCPAATPPASVDRPQRRLALDERFVPYTDSEIHSSSSCPRKRKEIQEDSSLGMLFVARNQA